MSQNPYPVLRPFRPDEAHLFFGRESLVDAMVDRLAAARFPAVLGSSGCGKSSLVNCGLRPALQRGVMAQAGSAWRIAGFRPGLDPIGELADALAAPGLLFGLAGCTPQGVAAGVAGGVQVAQADLVGATLRLSKRGLIDLVQQARLPAGTHLLLLVDQREELLHCRALAQAEQRAPDAVALVNRLLEACAQNELPIDVVMTMRSDFFGDWVVSDAAGRGGPGRRQRGRYLAREPDAGLGPAQALDRRRGPIGPALPAPGRDRGVACRRQEALRRNPELAQGMQPLAGQATLYIQFQAEEQRGPAESLRGRANSQQLNAPGIEKVRAGPAAPELRYFHEADLQEARKAVAWMLGSPGLQALMVKWVSGIDQKVKPGKMELWYGAPAKRLLVLAWSYTQRDNADAQRLSL